MRLERSLRWLATWHRLKFKRVTVILLDCQVLLTDGLAYLWRGVPASTAVGSANLSYRTGFASRECESRRPPSFGMARRQQI